MEKLIRKIAMARVTQFVCVTLIFVSCGTKPAQTRLRADDDQKLNPQGLGVFLSEAQLPLLQIGLANTTSGQITACQSKTRIENCTQASSVALTSKPAVSDRLIFESSAAIDPEKNGNFFAVSIEGKIALRFKLNTKTPDPNSIPGTNGTGVGSALTIATFAALNSDTSAPEGTILRDIVNHIPTDEIATFFDKNKMTWGHETSHGIHSYLRNTFGPPGIGVNAFYLLNGQYALVNEPKIRKSAVAQYVPTNLRGSRFQLYVVGQTAWDDRPLYIFDEWNAYVNGGATAVELAKKNLWTDGNLDAVHGIIEFNVYALATAMATKAGDPIYYTDYKQFREFIAYNIRRGMIIHNEGRNMDYFKGFDQEEYLQAFRTSPEAENLRAFAKEFLGADWCKEVLGF